MRGRGQRGMIRDLIEMKSPICAQGRGGGENGSNQVEISNKCTIHYPDVVI